MPSSTWSSARPDKLTLVSNARWQHRQNPPGIRHVQPEQHEKSLGSQLLPSYTQTAHLF